MSEFHKMRTLLSEAFRKTVPPERPIGACRVYVSVSGDKATIAMIGKATKAIGKVWNKKSHYGDPNAIYVGYDNFDGYALARGAVIVAALKDAGVSSYRAECGD